jgi:hypothetical protein
LAGNPGTGVGEAVGAFVGDAPGIGVGWGLEAFLGARVGALVGAGGAPRVKVYVPIVHTAGRASSV